MPNSEMKCFTCYSTAERYDLPTLPFTKKAEGESTTLKEVKTDGGKYPTNEQPLAQNNKPENTEQSESLGDITTREV